MGIGRANCDCEFCFSRLLCFWSSFLPPPPIMTKTSLLLFRKTKIKRLGRFFSSFVPGITFFGGGGLEVFHFYHFSSHRSFFFFFFFFWESIDLLLSQRSLSLSFSLSFWSRRRPKKTISFSKSLFFWFGRLWDDIEIIRLLFIKNHPTRILQPSCLLL